jgi:hypothetical protein
MYSSNPKRSHQALKRVLGEPANCCARGVISSITIIFPEYPVRHSDYLANFIPQPCSASFSAFHQNELVPNSASASLLESSSS